MEFEDENSDRSSDPVVVSAQQSARKGGTEQLSIEEGKSEMAVSRNDNTPEAIPSNTPGPHSFTSTPRRMYVENASDSRYNSAQLSVRIDESYQNSARSAHERSDYNRS